jgi:hypothetical protein
MDNGRVGFGHAPDPNTRLPLWLIALIVIAVVVLLGVSGFLYVHLKRKCAERSTAHALTEGGASVPHARLPSGSVSGSGAGSAAGGGVALDMTAPRKPASSAAASGGGVHIDAAGNIVQSAGPTKAGGYARVPTNAA